MRRERKRRSVSSSRSCLLPNRSLLTSTMNWLRSLLVNAFHAPTSEDMAHAKDTVEVSELWRTCRFAARSTASANAWLSHLDRP